MNRRLRVGETLFSLDRQFLFLAHSRRLWGQSLNGFDRHSREVKAEEGNSRIVRRSQPVILPKSLNCLQGKAQLNVAEGLIVLFQV